MIFRKYRSDPAITLLKTAHWGPQDFGFLDNLTYLSFYLYPSALPLSHLIYTPTIFNSFFSLFLFCLLNLSPILWLPLFFLLCQLNSRSFYSPPSLFLNLTLPPHLPLSLSWHYLYKIYSASIMSLTLLTIVIGQTKEQRWSFHLMVSILWIREESCFVFREKCSE